MASDSNNSNNSLFTLVNEVTDHVDVSVSLDAFPSLDAMFEHEVLCDGNLVRHERYATYQR